MRWLEDDEQTSALDCAVVDVSFQVNCKTLPMDHAVLLRDALLTILPWLQSEPGAAIHTIHGASSGNGWMRPPDRPGAMLELPKRTRLYLRLPASRITDAAELTDSRLRLGDTTMQLGTHRVRPLTPLGTVFARSVVAQPGEDEESFSRRLIAELEVMGVRVRKFLCGLDHFIQSVDGDLAARSVLLAELDPDESLRLQQIGVGRYLTLGCGIFLPHKSIAAVGGP